MTLLPSFVEVGRLSAAGSDEDMMASLSIWFIGFNAGRRGTDRRDGVWAWADGDEVVLTIPAEPIEEALYLWTDQ